MRTLLGTVFLLMFTLAHAQAPVMEAGARDEEPQRVSSGQQAPQGQQVAESNKQVTGGADLYYQLQVLQEEVRQLRGAVEQQQHELRQLKQRQMDDYMDLDRRLSNRGGGSNAAERLQPLPQPESDDRSATRNGDGGSDAEGERRSYNAAYNLLRERDFEAAATAFREHAQRFPDGEHAANAYYWLGEIHLLDNDLEAAREAFARVVDDYPDDAKREDAMYKLGRVYHLQGDDGRAREMLERVADTETSAAGLARNYLRDNFQ